jgi:hypothetical protein
MFRSIRPSGNAGVARAILALALFAIAAFAAPRISAQTPTAMASYQFQYLTSGATTDMSSATQIISSGVDDASSSVQSIGFTFNFGGTDYTQFSASSNGLLGLGSSTVSSTFSISMSTSPYPWISAMAVDQITRTNGVRYRVLGSSPSRILVVQWDTYRYATTTYTGLYEVRLYETTNEIQFVYGVSAANVTSWNGRVGLVASSSNYLQVNTSTNTTSTSDISGNSTFPASGTIYRFFVCGANVTIAGNTAQGAQTANMANGESMFSSVSVQRGSSASFTPFTITNPANACGTRTFTYTITGPASGDYSITPPSGSLTATQSNTPTVTFTPQGTGTRSATLTVSDNGTVPFQRSYALSATGTPRFFVTGNTAQGGTVAMNNGDTIMSAVNIYHGTCQNYTPFNLVNTNISPSATALTYTLALDSAGFLTTQYSIVGPTSGTITPGVPVTPTIRFCPTPIAFGPQEARLRITTSDGDTRIYILRAIAGAPAARFSIGSTDLTPGAAVFNQTTTCVGEDAAIAQIVVTNTGVIDLTIDGVSYYQIDTTDQQGTPMLPLLRDAQKRPIPATGYVLTTSPGVVPFSANTPATFPTTIGIGQSRTYYLTYIGAAPGRQYARMFIRTSAENFVGIDTNAYDNTTTMPTSRLGLMTLDLVARSVGSKIASDASGLRLKTVVFPNIKVGDTTEQRFAVFNAGACALRISRQALRIFSGDVNEFKLLSAFANTPVDGATNDYLLAPGAYDTIAISFIPSRSGTRMATLRFRTNDSTAGIVGVTERGVLLLDLQGVGRAGLDAHDLVLDPVAIGNSSEGTATLENSSTAAVEVARVVFSGGDAAEFFENTARPWPAMPAIGAPGAKLNLSVRLTPVGQPGIRRTQMFVITTTGDTMRVNIRGEAGTQQLVVAPTSLFDNVAIGVGGTVRQTVTIANNGTLPIRILPPVLSGPDSANYRIGILPRLDIEPGATEYLEVTFAPSGQGQSSAELTITPIGGASQVVTLGGTAVRVRGKDDPSTMVNGNIGSLHESENWTGEVSGADAENSLGGIRLAGAVPNPARSSVEIAYAVATRGSVRLELFDATGHAVRLVASGTVDAGEHRVMVDVSDLSAGVYHYRLTANGATTSRSLVVVH